MASRTKNKTKTNRAARPRKQAPLDALHARLRRELLTWLQGKGWRPFQILAMRIADEDADLRAKLDGEHDGKDPVAYGRDLLVEEMVARLTADGACELRTFFRDREIRLAEAAAAGAEGQPTPADAPSAPADPERAARPAVAAATSPPPATGGDVIVHLPVSGLGAHRAACDVPEMREEEWRQFRADVQARGVQEPLVVQRGGVVLDGRHRLRAAQETGQETVPARVVDLSEEEQAAFVYRAALVRRHLTDDQRAVLAALWDKAQSKATSRERARKAGQAGGRGRKKAADSSEEGASSKLSGQEEGKEEQTPRTRAKAVPSTAWRSGRSGPPGNWSSAIPRSLARCWPGR
jgi:hypothetical protein